MIIFSLIILSNVTIICLRAEAVADPGFEVRGGGGGGPLFYKLELHPPLRGFPEATIKVYAYLCISSEATIKVYTWIFLGFRIAPPLVFFFPEATIKVYTWIFFL